VNTFKKPFALAAIAALLLSFSPTTFAADFEDEQWVAPAEFQIFKQVEDAPHSFIMEDVVNGNTVVSHLFSNNLGKTEKEFERYICTNTNDGKCKDAPQYDYSAVFPTCESPSDINCVGALTAFGIDEKPLDATFAEYIVPGHFNNFPADAVRGIPQGSTGGIWTIPGAPHKFGNQYAIFVIASGRAGAQDKSGWPAAYDGLSARIVPISIKSTTKRTISWGTHQDNLLRPDTKANTRGGPFYDNNEGFRCIAPYGVNDDKCLIARAFPENIRFKLSIRLPKAPLGWLHGRMVDPDIEIANTGSNYTVTVQASPARIPSIFHGANWSELPRSVQELWEKVDQGCTETTCGFRSANNYSLPIAQQTTQLQPPNFGSRALSQLQVYLPVVKDTAIASPSTWSWRTLPADEVKTANGCFSAGDGIKGIVTTNASAYSAGPPEFKDGVLNYQVAAPHFNRDGTVFKGDYTLVLDSKVARCLYKFSSAPIQATISVVNNNGEPSIATTTVSEKNGWLRLVARNFEFSSPSINVKLTQEAPLKTEATTPATSVAPAKKVTITCVKGKITKKVTSTNPTCPKGYKKK
jgi:hypothetical protein